VSSTRQLGTERLNVVAFEAPGLGDRSYLVHDGEKAAVVDPQRDPVPYLAAATDLGVEITLVLETHVHNDYVSGGLALSRRAQATYGVPSGESVAFKDECELLDEGDALALGSLALSVLATPGHTPHHLSFLVEDNSGTAAVLTGGSLLAGATGRTDLLGPERAATLAQAQWASVRRLLKDLPAATTVLPTHGFGSFCSVGAVPATGELTIATEAERNPAALLELEAFVESLISDPLPVPAYYRYMAPLNRAGAGEPSHRPVPVVGPATLAELLARGTAIVDVRSRRAFAQAHYRGTLNIEIAPSLPTYLGWLVPFSAPLVFVSATLDDVLEARRLLARIGREDLAGWASDEFISALAPPQAGHYAVADFQDLARRSETGQFPLVLDVRFAHEWRSGHIRGARHVSLPEIGSVLSVLPGDEEIWVHCAAGFRAAIAASLLSTSGLRPVLVDDVIDNAVAAGLVVVSS
jgi:hydroxyacylglutathione hydrolase